MQARRRYELSDAQWARLEPLLPPEKPDTGRPNHDHRQILNGMLWVLNSGAPWRDLPRRYGPVGTVSSRFYRWRQSGPSRTWGSGRHGQIGGGLGFGLEQLAESGAELAVDDGAADLEQEIGAAAGPAHLLLLVHAAVDQEVGGAFGDRRADPLTGAMALGIGDQPGALAGETAVDLAQRRPQPARRGTPRAAAALAPEGRHGLAEALEGDPGIAGLAVPDPPAQPVDFRDDHRLGAFLLQGLARQAAGGLPGMLQAHGDMEPVEEWRLGDAGLGEDGAQPRTAIGEGGQHGPVGVADLLEAAPDQRFDLGIGPGDGGEQLAGAG